MISNSEWRYQAVYSIYGEDTKEYSICEVYLDKEGKLEAWTESDKMNPSGNSVDELLSDLQMMIDDVRKWKAVLFDSLYVGMVFERNDDYD